MSFDIFLKRYEDTDDGDRARAGVLEALRAYRYHGPDQFGFYIVEFADGTQVEFSGSELESEGRFSGCELHIRSGLGDDLMEFILRVAHAGDMVILPMGVGGLRILVSEDQKRLIPEGAHEGFREFVIGSPDGLRTVLKDGFDTWSGYRDRVLRKLRPNTEIR